MDLNRRIVVAGLAANVLSLPTMRVDAATAPTILEAAPAKLRLRPPPGAETQILAYGGVVPGPLVRLRQGLEARVRLVNKLTAPTTLCWHGLRIANAMDGVAGLTQPAVAPGQSFDYTFVPPDPGLFWYHPHVIPEAARQIRAGLYGLAIVEEPAPPPVDHDILVAISDWSLDAAAQLLDRPGSEDGLVTVNGHPAPLASSPTRPGSRVRLRLLNACASRILRVACVGMDATIIAIDGQPSEPIPPAGGMVPIGPGARFELMADLPREARREAGLTLIGATTKQAPLLRFVTQGEPVAVRPAFAGLPKNPALPVRIPLERALKRDMTIAKSSAGWTIDGAHATDLAGPPLFKVKKGNAVTLAFINRSTDVLQMHVHGHVFRVLHDLDDGWDPYWRDCLLVAPGKTKHVAFIADNPGKWAVESLVLDQQCAGLAGWFAVV